MAIAFERQTGVKVAMTRKSSGEFYAQVQAEAANPRGDIWWGHRRPMQRPREPDDRYQSPNLGWCMTLGRNVGPAKHRAVEHAGALGYGTTRITAKKAEHARIWADLTDPHFSEVQVAVAPPAPPILCSRRSFS
jgi:iron(III) transport system substrate-binding protein